MANCILVVASCIFKVGELSAVGGDELYSVRRDGGVHDASLVDVLHGVTQLTEYATDIHLRQPLHLAQHRLQNDL